MFIAAFLVSLRTAVVLDGLCLERIGAFFQTLGPLCQVFVDLPQWLSAIPRLFHRVPFFSFRTRSRFDSRLNSAASIRSLRSISLIRSASNAKVRE